MANPIDEHGDLILRIGEEEVKDFLVSSSAVRRASSVWDKMLFGPFRESKPAEGPWVVALPEDNPVAMAMFLHILHTNFGRVPEVLGIEDFNEAAILADKYDMLHVIGPWATRWMDNVKSANLAGEELIMAMYIALQLGAKWEFYDFATKVAAFSRSDAQGLMMNGVTCVDSVACPGQHDIHGMFCSPVSPDSSARA